MGKKEIIIIVILGIYGIFNLKIINDIIKLENTTAEIRLNIKQDAEKYLETLLKGGSVPIYKRDKKLKGYWNRYYEGVFEVCFKEWMKEEMNDYITEGLFAADFIRHATGNMMFIDSLVGRINKLQLKQNR